MLHVLILSGFYTNGQLKKLKIVSNLTGREFESQEERFDTNKKKLCVNLRLTALNINPILAHRENFFVKFTRFPFWYQTGGD